MSQTSVRHDGEGVKVVVRAPIVEWPWNLELDVVDGEAMKVMVRAESFDRRRTLQLVA